LEEHLRPPHCTLNGLEHLPNYPLTPAGVNPITTLFRSRSQHSALLLVPEGCAFPPRTGRSGANRGVKAELGIARPNMNPKNLKAERHFLKAGGHSVMAHHSTRFSSWLTQAVIATSAIALLSAAAFAQVGGGSAGGGGGTTSGASGGGYGAGGYSAPSGGYGQAAPNVSSGYLGTQSYTSWRAALCARDPRNCTNAPFNGYLGPNTPGMLPT